MLCSSVHSFVIYTSVPSSPIDRPFASQSTCPPIRLSLLSSNYNFFMLLFCMFTNLFVLLCQSRSFSICLSWFSISPFDFPFAYRCHKLSSYPLARESFDLSIYSTHLYVFQSNRGPSDPLYYMFDKLFVRSLVSNSFILPSLRASIDLTIWL